MADRLNVKALLRKHGLRPKKSWSQNFLVDLDTLARIVDAARLSADDVVVELGAGLGALTAMLAREAGRVVAVERDRDLAQVLRSEFAGDDRVELLEANAARLDFEALRERFGRRLVVVGNLPYHMASQIVFKLVEAGDALDRWLVMVQREMAQRMVAGPGSRRYGVMSIRLALTAEVTPELLVPPEAFLPAPRVQSQVVSGRPLPAPRVEVTDPALLDRLIGGVFNQRRKKVANGLKATFGRELAPDAIQEALQEAGVPPELRPEQLTVEQFAGLADALAARLDLGQVGGHQ